MSKVAPPFPLYAFTAWTGKTLPLALYKVFQLMLRNVTCSISFQKPYVGFLENMKEYIG